MKIFLYDQHHERIISELPLPIEMQEEVQKVIDWLHDNNILNQYSNLIIANDYGYECIDGECYITFFNKDE